MTSGALIVAVPASVGAAASFAVANVAQMRGARRSQTTRTLDPGLLLHLGADPLWLAGLGASIIGFALEATALAIAPVVLVQPLIVAELLFALPLAAAAGGSRLGRREWTGVGRILPERALRYGNRLAATSDRLEDLLPIVDRDESAVIPIELDVNDESVDRQTVQRVIEILGRLDVVANAAGYDTEGAANDARNSNARRPISSARSGFPEQRSCICA